MKIIECDNANNNAQFLISLIDDLSDNNSDCFWAVSDLDLVPLFHGDYSGTGVVQATETSYGFLKRVEIEKAVVVNRCELLNFLRDTLTVRNGVFVCFDNSITLDLISFRPKVETKKSENLYDKRSKYEIRVLDGSLFIVITK